jgi:inward rectifier potassium channel
MSAPTKPALPATEEEVRDLGFGALVATQARERLLNRDGTFNVKRRGLGLFETVTPYHAFVMMSWPKFLGLTAAFYVGINILFAIAYLLCGASALQGAEPALFGGNFMRAFFFSVETFGTIGYGQIAPVGVTANAIMTFEALVALMSQALVTGFLFSRFARPTAAILFSDRALMAPYHGGSALMFRIVNQRSNQIIELQAQVLLSWVVDKGGERKRRFVPLKLERDKVTFFPLSWTLVHPIDERSPLWGVDEPRLQTMDAEVLILLSGIDETFAQQVHTRSSYKSHEIIWNAKFRNIFDQSATDGNGDIALDVDRVHEYERLP